MMPIFSAVLIGVTLVVTFRTVAKSREMSRLSDDIIRGMFDLSIVSHEYVAEGEKRAEVQWRRKHESLTQLARDARGQTEEEQGILARVRRRLESIGALFGQLVLSREEEQSGRRSPELSEEWRRRLVGQIMVMSQSMVSDAKQLARLSHNNLARTQTRAYAFIAAVLLLLMVALGLISLGIGRSIRRPVEALRAAARTVASGDLERHVECRGRDEIGDLARAFNEMTQSLKASDSDLREEIREREKAQRELQLLNETLERRVQERTAELTRSNQSLQQFAYVASHDLQEPLRAVEGYSQVLAKRYGGQLDDRADEFIQHIVEGVERMKSLIKGLLEYSRIGSRGRPLRAVDLGASLQEALKNLGAAIQESNAEVSVDRLPTVTADPEQMSRLLQNLIANAVKFRGEAPPRVHVSAERDDDRKRWIVCVRDNGVGIEPSYRDQIFLLFKRLHTRDQYEGTGIGLSICKRIVERHGGEIWLESEPGSGSAFFFTVPDRAPEPDPECDNYERAPKNS